MITEKPIKTELGERILVYSDLLDKIGNAVELAKCFDVFSVFVKANSKRTTNQFIFYERKNGDKFFNLYGYVYIELWKKFKAENLLPIKTEEA